MQSFTLLESIAAPLPRANVDTDTIWPAMGGGSALKGQQADKAFAALRFDEHGYERVDFMLNREPYRHAKILIAGSNFGCGSSREMAVWALVDWGLRCVIAPSFGDIFYNNACLNGLLPVVLPIEAVEDFTKQASDASHSPFTVDLMGQTVCAPNGRSQGFEINPYHRHLLLEGLDEIGYTLSQLATIEAFEQGYQQQAPWAQVEFRA